MNNKTNRHSIKQPMNRLLLITWSAALFIFMVLSILFFSGCSNDPVGTSGTSASGYSMAIKANPGEVNANGTDTALIVVEVWDANGNYVDGETVTFSSTQGSLANDTVLTVNGSAVNTYTSSTNDGMAVIAAAVENIVAKAEIVQYYTDSD